jgi:tRNA-(ms[2]io[6]A)-hydroxylase
MGSRDDAIMAESELPLRFKTPGTWAAAVLTEPLALLNDHAHLEKKAAANALELLNRWPQSHPPENWVTAMTAVARDEVEHLAVVTRLLARRGGKLSRQHSNPYASELHKLVRKGLGRGELIDRLMISSLIEARSCERFLLLSQASGDVELTRLYKGLWASEHGHYLSFLHLAEVIEPAEQVAARWEQMLDEEAAIIQRQPIGPRMHSGVKER